MTEVNRKIQSNSLHQCNCLATYNDDRKIQRIFCISYNEMSFYLCNLINTGKSLARMAKETKSNRIKLLSKYNRMYVFWMASRCFNCIESVGMIIVAWYHKMQETTNRTAWSVSMLMVTAKEPSNRCNCTIEMINMVMTNTGENIWVNIGVLLHPLWLILRSSFDDY